MKRKFMLVLLIAIILIIAVLAYMFVASDYELKFGKGSSVATTEQAELEEATGLIDEAEEIDIGDVI